MKPAVPTLTDLQHNTLRQLVQGVSQTEIARQEGVSKQAVSRRVQRIARKLGARNTAEAIVIAVRAGLV